MAKIQFNIKFRPQIESGEYKVEIGKSEPWPARIVCWDLNGNDLIVLVANPDGREEGLIYTPEGKHKAYAPRIDSELFIVTPEEERTPFEDRLAEIIVSSQGLCTFGACKDEAKRYAPELLTLAEKEIGLRAKQSALNELAREHNEQMSYRREPSHFSTISTDEREFLADEFTAFLSNYEKEFDDDAPQSDVAEHFFLCGKKWGADKAMANLRESLAHDDIFRTPQWLREALEKAYQKGKNATTHA